MKTYNVRLKFESLEDEQKLLDTLESNKKIWNYISNYVYKNNLTTNNKIIHDANYHPCRNEFPEAPSQFIIRAINDVVSTYKTLKSNIRNKLIKIDSITHPCFKNNLSVRLDKRIYRFVNKNTITLTTNTGRITSSFDIYPKLYGLYKYKLSDPLIFYRDKQFWISLTFEIPEPIHEENTCTGVDLGLKRIAATSEGLIISGNHFLKQKRKIRYNKRKLKSKNTQSSKRHLKKLKVKERNVSNNFIHHVANKILETKSNTIVIEDLSKIKQQDKGHRFNNRLSQIPLFNTKEILTYKALSLGKKIVTVNPAYTSKEDYRGIKQGIRKGCRYYASDGIVLDSDVNASINIGLRYSNKTKLPLSFVEPIDGSFKTIEAGFKSIIQTFEIQTSPTALAQGN